MMAMTDLHNVNDISEWELAGSDVIVLDWLVREVITGVAGEKPEHGVTPATDLRQQGHPRSSGSEGSLLLGLLHQGLVREYRFKLITGDSDDEHPE